MDTLVSVAMSDPFGGTIEEIEDEKLLVLARILTNHQGSDNPITSAELSTKIGERDAHATNPDTRELIRELIFEYQFPVASSTQGYYLISDEEEFREYVKSLTERRDKIDSRIDAFCQAAQKNFGFAPDPDLSQTERADSGRESASSVSVGSSTDDGSEGVEAESEAEQPDKTLSQFV